MARVFITALSVVVTLTITPVDCTGAPQSAQSATPKTASVARRAKPPAPSAMSNQDVVTLVGAGLAEDIIITNIRQSPSRAFDLSAEALVALKRNGVSDNIIRVMLDPDATVPASAPPPPAAATTAEAPSPAAVPDAPLPSEVGVYLRAAGKLTDIEPEIVNWKTGGILKTMATVGFKGPHVNGWVRNSTSRLELPTDAEVVVMTPEGTPWNSPTRRSHHGLTWFAPGPWHLASTGSCLPA